MGKFDGNKNINPFVLVRKGVLGKTKCEVRLTAFIARVLYGSKEVLDNSTPRSLWKMYPISKNLFGEDSSVFRRRDHLSQIIKIAEGRKYNKGISPADYVHIFMLSGFISYVEARQALTTCRHEDITQLLLDKKDFSEFELGRILAAERAPPAFRAPNHRKIRMLLEAIGPAAAAAQENGDGGGEDTSCQMHCVIS